MVDLVRVGSETAKGGFANEIIVARKFNYWETDKEAQKWLRIMGYKLKSIRSVEATVLHGYKTDVQIGVIIKLKRGISVQNLSVKKSNKDADYNQVDKRWIRNYKELWDIPDKIVELLKIFTGEISPKELLKQEIITKEKYNSLRDKYKRRLFLDEFNEEDRNLFIKFFNDNKILIVADVIKGRDEFAADWMLVTSYNKQENETTWILADINKAISIFGHGDVRMSPQGSLYIGKITLQRKGGDGGRETSKMLQFKIRPSHLFSNQFSLSEF